MDKAADVQTGLQTHPQVQPGVPGPYLVPKTAEAGAGASDDAVAVPDVLEARKSTKSLVQTPADVASAWAGVLGSLGGLWRPQKPQQVVFSNSDNKLLLGTLFVLLKKQ